MKLRDGLLFHDGEPVRSIDCITSINRWAKRNGFGQRMMTQLAEMKVVDDKSFVIRLTKPFPHLPYALGESPCYIMPERIAKTDAFQQIKEYVGSGPYQFLPKEWVSGSGAAWARFDKYVPRQEKADLFSGGKVAHFDRVQWTTMPDPATKAAALQSGEVDWVEQPLIDLLPMLRKSPGVVVETLDPVGVVAIIGVNHTQPPFDNRKLLQAILPAVDQREFMSAVVGDQMDLAKTGVGFFTLGTPLANDAGMEVLTGPRNVALAKKLVSESGYKGEPILLMSPSDQPGLAGDGAGHRQPVQEHRPQLAIYEHGLGHARLPPREPRAGERGRVERVLHDLDGPHLCRSPAARTRCAATARRAGSGGPTIRRWRRCATNGSTRPISPRRRRWPRTSSASPSSTCPTSRPASISSRRRIAAT